MNIEPDTSHEKSLQNDINPKGREENNPESSNFPQENQQKEQGETGDPISLTNPNAEEKVSAYFCYEEELVSKLEGLNCSREEGPSNQAKSDLEVSSYAHGPMQNDVEKAKEELPENHSDIEEHQSPRDFYPPSLHSEAQPQVLQENKSQDHPELQPDASKALDSIPEECSQFPGNQVEDQDQDQETLEFASDKTGQVQPQRTKSGRLRKPLYNSTKEEEKVDEMELEEKNEREEMKHERQEEKKDPEWKMEKILRKGSKRDSASAGKNMKSSDLLPNHPTMGKMKKRDKLVEAKDINKEKIPKKSTIKKCLKNYSDLVKILSNHIKFDWFESGPFQNKLIPSKHLTPICLWFMFCSEFFPRSFFQPGPEEQMQKLRQQLDAFSSEFRYRITKYMIQTNPEVQNFRREDTTAACQEEGQAFFEQVRRRINDFLLQNDNENKRSFEKIVLTGSAKNSYNYEDDMFILETRKFLLDWVKRHLPEKEAAIKDPTAKLNALQRVPLEQLIDLYSLEYNDIKKSNNSMLDEVLEKAKLEREGSIFNKIDYKWEDVLVDLEILLPEEEEYLKYLENKQQNTDFSFYVQQSVPSASSKSTRVKNKPALSSSQLNEEPEAPKIENEIKEEEPLRTTDLEEPQSSFKELNDSQACRDSEENMIPSNEDRGNKSCLEEEAGVDKLIPEGDDLTKTEEQQANMDLMEDIDVFDANGQNNSNEKLKKRIFMEDMVCQVCNDGDYSEDNLIVFCAKCNIAVHQKCYGIVKVPQDDWVCEACRAFGPNGKYLRCPLCTRRGGAMKPAKIKLETQLFQIINPSFNDFLKACIENRQANPRKEDIYVENQELIDERNLKDDENYEKKLYYNFLFLKNFSREELSLEPKPVNVWTHITCALWIPEVFFEDRNSYTNVKGLDNIDKKRFALTCHICKSKKTGACIQCAQGKCQSAFHPECARRANLFMEVRSVDKIQYLIFCEKHTPLKLRRVIEAKDKRYKEEISKFCRVLEKFCETYKYEQKLQQSNLLNKKKYLKLYLNQSSHKPSKSSEDEKEFVKVIKEYMLTLPEYRFIVTLQKLNYDGQIAKKELSNDSERIAGGGGDDSRPRNLYKFCDFKHPRHFYLRSNISRNDEIWKTIKYKNYNSTQLYQKYRKIKRGGSLIKLPKSLKKLNKMSEASRLSSLKKMFESPSEKKKLRERKKAKLLMKQNQIKKTGLKDRLAIFKQTGHGDKKTSGKIGKVSSVPSNIFDSNPKKEIKIKPPKKQKPLPLPVEDVADSTVAKNGENVFLEEEYNEDNKLYCLCRKKYDGLPMMQCDKCEEWYHFECVGFVGTDQDAESITFVCEKCEELEEPKIVQQRKNQYKRLFKKAFPRDEEMVPTPKKKLKPNEVNRESEDVGNVRAANSSDDAVKITKKITDYFPGKAFQEQALNQDAFNVGHKKKKDLLKARKKHSKLHKKKLELQKKKLQKPIKVEPLLKEREEIFVENRDDDHPIKIQNRLHHEQLHSQQHGGTDPPQVKVVHKRGRKKKADKLRMEEEKNKQKLIEKEEETFKVEVQENINNVEAPNFQENAEMLQSSGKQDVNCNNNDEEKFIEGKEELLGNDEEGLYTHSEPRTNDIKDEDLENNNEGSEDQPIYRNKLRTRK